MPRSTDTRNELKMKAILLLASVLTIGGAMAQQSEVETSGVGIAETKVSACEIALDQARREAAQAATTIVQSTFSSVGNDKGVSHTSDQVVTSKAYAKLIDKTEQSSFDSESGLIKCEVSAQFSAGFVVDETIQGASDVVGSSRNVQNLSDFKAGEPFCSRIMDMCFREIYSSQLGEFGIQVLPSKKQREKYLSSFMDQNGFNMFFNKVKSRTSKDWIEVNTEKVLLDYIKKQYETNKASACDRCVIIPMLYVNMYKWNDKKGFQGGKSELLMNSKTELGPRGMSVSDAYVEELDKLMADFNQSMSDLN